MSCLKKNTKRFAPGSGAGAIDPALVHSTVRSAVEEAERALDGAIVVLRAAGVDPKTPLPLNFLLKLAACVRLYQWEAAGVLRLADPSLPTCAEAWQDLVTAPRLGKER